MPTVAKLVNGSIRMVDLDITPYDESITVPFGGYPPNQVLTLPSSGTYTDDDLVVILNGQDLEENIDYSYVGVAPRTQIQMAPELFEKDIVRFRRELT